MGEYRSLFKYPKLQNYDANVNFTKAEIGSVLLHLENIWYTVML